MSKLYAIFFLLAIINLEINANTLEEPSPDCGNSGESCPSEDVAAPPETDLSESPKDWTADEEPKEEPVSDKVVLTSTTLSEPILQQSVVYSEMVAPVSFDSTVTDPKVQLSIQTIDPGRVVFPDDDFDYKPTVTPKPRPTPTPKPRPTPTPKPVPFPTQKPGPLPTQKPGPLPTQRPSPLPTQKPGPLPTQRPSPLPTQKPGPLPTQKPGPRPTVRPKPTTMPNPDYTIEEAKDPDAVPTKRPPVRPPVNVIRQCMLTCGVTSEYNPVCGSDGVTYTNPGRLGCAQDCGADVKMVAKGYCDVNTVPTTSAPVVTIPPVTTLRECISDCPMTTEYKPVCGTDGVTYINPGEIVCAQLCGVPVRPASFGRCTSKPTPVEPTIEPGKETEETDPKKIEQCLLNCKPTSEYSPVCGSNGIIYPSPARLDCARKCGIKVYMVSRGPCAAPPRPTQPTAAPTDSTTSSPMSTTTLSIEMQSCISRCPATPEFNPVCGTDLRTYDNYGKLHCASVCGVDVAVLRLGPCIPGRRNRNRISTTTTLAPI